MNDVINVIYGTLSGNSEDCAKNLCEKLNQHGFQTDLNSISEIDATFLQKCTYVFLCISTYGDGEPPDDAWDQWDAMVESQDNDFKNFKYSVLALGDTDYELFCEAGKRFDEAFHNQGATRVISRVDCNVEFEKLAEEWSNKVLEYLQGVES